MTFKGLLIHVVGVRTYSSGTPDRYGNDSPSWGTAVSEQARVEQTKAVEVLGDRDLTLTWFRVFFLPDVVVHAKDHLEWSGRTLEVDGEPTMWYDSHDAHHVTAIAKEIDE